MYITIKLYELEYSLVIIINGYKGCDYSFSSIKMVGGRESISISNAITLVFGHIRNDGLTLFSVGSCLKKGGCTRRNNLM